MIFLDDDLEKLGRAFDRAWDRFLRTGMLRPENLRRSQEIIARSILDRAKLGERDEWRLARDAFLQLSQVESPKAPESSIRKRKSPQSTQSLDTTKHRPRGARPLAQ
jgi:hypothetical protein